MIEEEYYNRQTRNCIYLATCLTNNKIYIGKTEKPLVVRISRHKTDSKKQKSIWYNAIRKHGFDSILWQIIYVMPNQDTLSLDEKAELNNKEIEYIKLYKSTDRDRGYNTTFGGMGGEPTEDVKQKLRELAKRKNADPEYRKKLSESAKLYYSNITEEEKIKRRTYYENLSEDDKIKRAILTSVLTEEQAKLVIELLYEGYQQKDIAEIMQINHRLISDIHNRKTWRFLDYDKSKSKTYKWAKSSIKSIKVTKLRWPQDIIEKVKRNLALSKSNEEILNSVKDAKQSLISAIKYHGKYAYILPELNKDIYGYEPEIIYKEQKMKFQKKKPKLKYNKFGTVYKSKFAPEIIKKVKIAILENKSNKEILQTIPEATQSLVSDIRYHGRHLDIMPELNLMLYGQEAKIEYQYPIEQIKEMKNYIALGYKKKRLEKLEIYNEKLYNQIRFQNKYQEV